MKKTIEIIFETNAKKKADYTQEVLIDLPEWFGIPDATATYVEEAKGLPFWVALVDGQCAGFIDLKETSDEAAELSCMGVKRAFHHQGIGTQLFTALEDYAKERYRYLQVKTLAQGQCKEYDSTIRFYQAQGFAKLEVFPTLWGESNPCLILVKSLNGGKKTEKSETALKKAKIN